MPIERVLNGLQSRWQSGTVPIPNAVLDMLLPTLRDTELRILLIVIRQTLGWQERGEAIHRRKYRDYISHSQLCRKAGRTSAAVSSAVDSLIRRSLIVVEDEAGRKLITPDERRRHLGRLFFRPVGFALGIASENGGKRNKSTV